MTLNFNIAKSWNELNEWQLKKIAKVMFSDSNKKTELLLIVSYLFIQKPTFKNVFKFFRLLFQVPFSSLKTYTDFLYTETDLTKFPKKIKGLYGPSDRLANLTIEEFTYADLFFYNWTQKRDTDNLNRLVAVLYRPKGSKQTKHIDARKPFIKEELRLHASIVEKIPQDVKLTILMAFQGSRERMRNRYTHVFSKGGASKQSTYAPFTKIINSMSRGETQPFGDYYKTKKANIYDFFDVLNEDLKLQKERERKSKK